MTRQEPFLIYNASAGSGKTYSLVKTYLQTLLKSNHPDYYKNLLAITFTNKAVAEMKERIIHYLKLFSDADLQVDQPEMMKSLANDCDLSLDQIQQRSKNILHHLLHHYSAFCVETIDGFNHRLIRTFSRDLKISGNFEVSLDVDELLDQAVDNLIQKAGEDAAITDTLVNFALLKTDEDRSWDVSRDITKAAGILFRENDLENLDQLRGLSLADFKSIIKKLKNALKDTETKLLETANQTLDLLDKNGLEFTHFDRSSYPKYMMKLSENKPVNHGLQWQGKLREKPLYPSKVAKNEPEVAAIMDQLAPEFADAFDTSKELYFRKNYIETLLSNLIPLSVVNLVQQELDLIKEEDNILPISEFNKLIYQELKEQPAPYIYERLGERYRHFYIDEFQDTSKLQWNNLMPLIDNALSQEENGTQGSLLLVGDAKQSIYRWRGGLPEQFIELYNCSNPFSVQEKKVLNLETNWRSYSNLIDFNNSFFTFVSNYFDDIEHQELYRIGNQQEKTEKQGGYVSIDFLEYATKEEALPLYSERVLNILNSAFQDGFEPKDICILTRKKKEGIELGQVLMDSGIPVVSSESLLLAHSEIVLFLADFLTFRSHQDNDELKSKLLIFLHSHFKITIPLADFLSDFFTEEEQEFSNSLESHGIELDVEHTNALSLYESSEYLLNTCNLASKADAYVDGFLNLIHDFEKRNGLLKISFEEFWESKKEKEAISIPEGVNAVRLMTIHKSKGLEFPVLIFPYAEVDIYKELSPKAWVKPKELTGSDIPLMINFNSDVAEYSAEGTSIYNERRSQLQLDNINLLYVTLTRAIQRCYILSRNSSKPKDNVPRNYSHFFRNYLEHKGLWEEDCFHYEFGTRASGQKTAEAIQKKEVSLSFISEFPESNNLKVISSDASLWLTEAQLAISAGSELHDLMEKIKFRYDAEEALEQMETRSDLSDEEKAVLRKMVERIVEHPDLTEFFSSEATVMNERDIVTKDGQLLRPDRLNFHGANEVTVIDYKTGDKSARHGRQINSYTRALTEMGFRIRDSLLIYVSEDDLMINKL
ncbi:UvrD-helicase domain-containing protein [Aureitalea sp. L0-47]|uniref:UvrD-helicase domain-containing protein n=1 Tax=Aureitalea sp. L0-47 TaxID=2816962 RepID=UPI00223776BA|nr:UvrD-helicase domain-containing protein [Aureitalea sp. L0-47]MCW5519858.1 UvrD-helicase domain-containing protein [Aureitalea sp. L0-47]